MKPTKDDVLAAIKPDEGHGLMNRTAYIIDRVMRPGGEGRRNTYRYVMAGPVIRRLLRELEREGYLVRSKDCKGSYGYAWRLVTIVGVVP